MPHDEPSLWRELIEIRKLPDDSVESSSLAYDDLHAAGGLRQRDSFYKWLIGLLSPRPGQKLLDISCGQGSLLRFAERANVEIFGLDLSSIAAAKASELTIAATITVGDAERLPFADSSFDFLTNIGSIEHYFHPHCAVQEMGRVLKANGRACILLPNTFGLLGNILHVWRTGDVFDDGQPLQRYGTRRQWQNLLERYGLQVDHVLKYEREWPRTWTDAGWYLLHPHKLVRVILSTIIPLNLSSFLVFLCSKQSAPTPSHDA